MGASHGYIKTHLCYRRQHCREASLCAALPTNMLTPTDTAETIKQTLTEEEVINMGKLWPVRTAYYNTKYTQTHKKLI